MPNVPPVRFPEEETSESLEREAYRLRRAGAAERYWCDKLPAESNTLDEITDAIEQLDAAYARLDSWRKTVEAWRQRLKELVSRAKQEHRDSQRVVAAERSADNMSEWYED